MTDPNFQGLLVKETQPKVKAGEPKIFNVSFTSIGTETCIYVDFDVDITHRKIFTNEPSVKCNKAGYE